MKTFLENLSKYWVTPIVAIVGGLLGLYFSIVKNDLEKQASNLESTALRIETELKQKEFSNDLKLHMYTEVKDAITKGDKKVQSAVLLIVNELLADDSAFRDKLIDLLRASPNTSDSVKVEIQRMVRTENAFFTEQTRQAEDTFTIDVFYLEDVKKEALPRAKKVKEMLQQYYPDYNIRLRLMPKTVNARSTYRIEANQIRYDKTEEELAKKCLELLKSERIFSLEQPSLYEVKRATPNYMSIFVRNM
jgi:hypothetical protein